MKTVTVTITDTDNAAFDDWEWEVKRILRRAGEHVGDCVRSGNGKLLDFNGNVVGEWRVEGQ